MPGPVLPQFEAVTLETGEAALDGTYAVDCEGGTHYRLLVGAQPAESVPGEATVTPVSGLPDRRREVALAAIGNERVTVSPETRLGEWVRHGWFGGFFRHDGTVYRGTEVRQTDAALFSETLWIVLSLSPVAGSDVDGPTLRFPDLDPSVRAFVDGELANRTGGDEGVARTVDPLPDPVRSFAPGTEYLLTHTAVYEVEVVDGTG